MKHDEDLPFKTKGTIIFTIVDTIGIYFSSIFTGDISRAEFHF